MRDFFKTQKEIVLDKYMQSVKISAEGRKKQRGVIAGAGG